MVISYHFGFGFGFGLNINPLPSSTQLSIIEYISIKKISLLIGTVIKHESFI